MHLTLVKMKPETKQHLNNFAQENSHSKINTLFLIGLDGNLSLEDFDNFELNKFSEDQK